MFCLGHGVVPYQSYLLFAFARIYDTFSADFQELWLQVTYVYFCHNEVNVRLTYRAYVIGKNNVRTVAPWFPPNGSSEWCIVYIVYSIVDYLNLQSVLKHAHFQPLIDGDLVAAHVYNLHLGNKYIAERCELVSVPFSIQ